MTRIRTLEDGNADGGTGRNDPAWTGVVDKFGEEDVQEEEYLFEMMASAAVFSWCFPGDVAWAVTEERREHMEGNAKVKKTER